jgi:hypothetical protein
MRQTISGLLAAIAVVAASSAPAMACGGLFDSCGGCGYVSPCAQIYVPAYTYGGCNTGCGGWGFERLPDPVAQYHAAPTASPQYYYVDQGPTYTGPGNFAPYPTYREGGVYGGYRHHHRHYGYGYRGHVLSRYY